MKVICVLFFLLAVALTAFSQSSEFTDNRDGRVYNTITIGEQIWLAENLKYKPEFGNYCTYNNDPRYLEKYGYLYDWETSMAVCPSGWHLPSGDELQTLLKSAGGKGYASYKALTSKRNPGFSAPLAGWRILWGTFVDLDITTGFWSSALNKNSSQEKKEAWRIAIRGGKEIQEAGLISSDIRSGFSVRCLKD